MATSIKRKSQKNIGTSAVAVGAYTAPSVTTGVFITGLVCCNTTVNSVTVTADIFDGTTHFNLCTNSNVPPGASISLADHGNRIGLNANDQVFVTSSATSSIDVNMTVMEIQ